MADYYIPHDVVEDNFLDSLTALGSLTDKAYHFTAETLIDLLHNLIDSLGRSGPERKRNFVNIITNLEGDLTAFKKYAVEAKGSATEGPTAALHLMLTKMKRGG